MESNHVPLDTLSVEFAVLPPHSQVLLFPNPLVVLKLAVHLPLNVLPLLRARAGLQCPASLSQSHFLLLSVDECPHKCLGQRHNATDWQTHSVNTVYDRTCDYHANQEGILTFWSNCLIVSYTMLLIVVARSVLPCPTSWVYLDLISWVIDTSLTITIQTPAWSNVGVVVNRFESGRHLRQSNTKVFTTGMEHSVS